MAGIGPIKPVVGWVNTTPQLSAEQQQGGPADPRHRLPLLTHPVRHSWQLLAGLPPSGPYGVQAQMVGSTDGAVEPAGSPSDDPMFDRTPRTRAAPWPKGTETTVDPDAVARTLTASRDIHASNTGASARVVRDLEPVNDTWQGFYKVGSGSTIQDPAIPRQLKSQASTDRVSSFARQNEHGFDSAHSGRRWATGSVPGNYMWMRPGGRPLIKTTPGPARPATGADSPFTGDDLTAAYGVTGAVLQTAPTDYVPPGEPYIAPSGGTAVDPAPVKWW
jgi:hypothetical protein